MNERKILLFILSVIVYCMYSVHMWFMKQNGQANAVVPDSNVEPAIALQADKQHQTQEYKRSLKRKIIPLFVKDACSVLEVFTQTPMVKRKRKQERLSTDNNTITCVCITVFLLILLINAILEAIRVKEEEKAKRKLNPDGERRQSLAEFANKKTSFRRESSKLGMQLFQIAESFVSSDSEEKQARRQVRPYTRGESTNSYLSEVHRKPQEGSAPASVSETPAAEPRLVKRQSVAKLIGARPIPMVRRSSFPVLPLNPEVQALMLGHRQQSVDSDDEDGKGRRVRIIRRY